VVAVLIDLVIFDPKLTKIDQCSALIRGEKGKTRKIFSIVWNRHGNWT
jgi:hypothetical protein